MQTFERMHFTIISSSEDQHLRSNRSKCCGSTLVCKNLTKIHDFCHPYGTKCTPGASRERPGAPQDGPKTAQDGSKTAQEAPKTAQYVHKTAQEATKTAHEAPKTTPRRPKKRPRRPKRPPKRVPDIDPGSGEAQGWLRGGSGIDIFSQGSPGGGQKEA